MYKISIIIPIYNAKHTLNRAIDSIFNQKWNGNIFEDIEILLIDDCSTDGTKEIIDEYSNKFSNINVYSTESNTGNPAKPRNIGIERSSADYLMFMDNDDEFCPDICQTLFETITKENVDVVVCNYYHNFLHQGCSKYNLNLNVDSFTENNDFILLDSFNSILFNDILPWNKIFDKSKLISNNLFYPTSYPESILDDRFFFIEFYSKIDSLIYLKDYYGVIKYTSDSSLSLNPDKKMLIDGIIALRKLHNLADNYINFNINSEFKFNFTREVINNFLYKITLLTNKNDMYDCLKKISEFENEISFDNSINGVNKLINSFILKNHLFLARVLILLLQFVRKSKFLRELANVIFG